MVTLGISIFGNYYTSIMKNFNSKTVHVLKTLFYLFDSAKWLNEKGDYSYFLMSKSTVSFTILQRCSYCGYFSHNLTYICYKLFLLLIWSELDSCEHDKWPLINTVNKCWNVCLFVYVSELSMVNHNERTFLTKWPRKQNKKFDWA